MTFAIKRPRRRTVLFMPGDDLRKIQRGVSLAGVDTIAMDLEDGVALNRKQAARDTVCHALDTVDFGRVERLVRLNTPASTLQQDDLAQTVAQHPDGYVLPKVESAETVQAVSGQLGEVERARGWPVGGIRLLALIETARGVLRLDEIAGSDERLDALVFGAEDFAGDIGATRTQAGWEVFHARSAVVIAAAAYGLQAIDTVFTALDDLDGLRADAQRALQMGYDGKLAIHPRQVPVICEVFTPSADEVARAQALMQAFDEHQRQGAGAFELNGRMVDMPMVRAARRVLQRAGAS